MRAHSKPSRKTSSSRRPEKSHGRHRKLFFEPLEDRRLLASVSVAYQGPDGAESGEAVKFLVSRSVSDASSLTVNFTLSGTATEGTDYTGASSVTIQPWMSTANVILGTTQDTTDEGVETVILNITASSNYTIGIARAGAEKGISPIIDERSGRRYRGGHAENCTHRAGRICLPCPQSRQ
jgi:Planctomycete extracellular